MNNDKLIAEMRKCNAHCRVGILRSKTHTNLCWIGNKRIHTERVTNDDELQAALNRAKLELEYQ